MNSIRRLKSLPLIIAIVVGFIFSFFKHISVMMYLLTAVIFYFYLPMLYSYSRVNFLYHVKAKEFIHLKYYPQEFLFWLLATCFFSFILAHLLADLAYGFEKNINEFIYFLIFIDLNLIIYREFKAKKLQNIDEIINYEKQGRLITFEILFLFILLFLMKH